VTGGGKLGQAELGFREHVLRFVEPLLLEQRATEHDLRVADLVQEVCASLEQLERVTSLLLGEVPLTRTQVNLGE
jgi:hypothetical protein